MTDKIHGYEDEHRVNHYGLRFRSDAKDWKITSTADTSHKSLSYQNTTPLNGGTCSVSEPRLGPRYHDFAGVGEQNSCERSIPTQQNGGSESTVCNHPLVHWKPDTDAECARCGHVFPTSTIYLKQNGGDEPSGDASTRKDEAVAVPALADSPTYTREELVEIMGDAASCCSCGEDVEAALDALIAIGAVRVK